MKPSDGLLADLPVTRPLRSRRWTGLSLSVAVHLGIAAVAVGLIIAAPLELPETRNIARVLLFNPAPPPPPPLPKGLDATFRAERPRPLTTSPAEQLEQPNALTAPIVVPVRLPRPDPGVLESQQAGSPNGGDLGVPEGSELGVEGGQVGGVPGGLLKGIEGGSGTDPVPDYERGPEIIRRTTPAYPDEAFVQKISGTVLLEIVIDARGYVAQHRILHSIPQLDSAAIACVHQWRFTPALKHGRPVASMVHATVAFVNH
jgi:TonB family protein